MAPPYCVYRVCSQSHRAAMTLPWPFRIAYTRCDKNPTDPYSHCVCAESYRAAMTVRWFLCFRYADCVHNPIELQRLTRTLLYCVQNPTELQWPYNDPFELCIHGLSKIPQSYSDLMVTLVLCAIQGVSKIPQSYNDPTMTPLYGVNRVCQIPIEPQWPNNDPFVLCIQGLSKIP